MSTNKLNPGDNVSWRRFQGIAVGKIMKRLVAHREIKGFHVAASSHDPEALSRAKAK